MSDLPRFAVVALAFVRKDDSVLLVKQNYGDHCWSLPGGAMELGESIDQAAIREVKEETGLDIRIKRIVGLYSKPSEAALAIAFEGEVIGGSVSSTATDEITECRYFPFGHLPEPVREHLRQRVEDFRQGYPSTVFRTQ